MSPTRTIAGFLEDAANADPFQVAMAQHAAMHDALCADLLGVAARHQSGFDRLDAMRARLNSQGERE